MMDILSSQKQQVLCERQQFLDVRAESQIGKGGSCALTLLNAAYGCVAAIQAVL